MAVAFFLDIRGQGEQHSFGHHGKGIRPGLRGGDFGDATLLPDHEGVMS
jgi:hypothetical protein